MERKISNPHAGVKKNGGSENWQVMNPGPTIHRSQVLIQ